jgi:hypothetical protein
MNIPSVPHQRRSFHSGTDFNGRHRSVHDGLNASGMSGPSSHSPRRVAFSTVVSRISASPPLESTGPNHGPARGAPGVAQGMGRRESISVPFHRLGRRIALKFRLKGAAKSGISLRQALYRERLSQRNTYSLHDIAPNMSGMITLRVRVRILPCLLDPSSPCLLYTVTDMTSCCVISTITAPRRSTMSH